MAAAYLAQGGCCGFACTRFGEFGRLEEAHEGVDVEAYSFVATLTNREREVVTSKELEGATAADGL